MLQSEALQILKMGRNVFLTGEPGSGKTHLINQYVDYLNEHGISVAITASTGISATHIGGLTIHSWSGIGIRQELSTADLKIIAATKYITRRIKNTKVLIIDEISMLPGSTLVMVDAVCREVKKNDLPFGGMQVVLVGDFFQLPPVVKSNQSSENNDDYSQMSLMEEPVGRFAYQSPIFKRAKLVTCYLTEQHRQDDEVFLSILSAIRRGKFTKNQLTKLEARKIDYEKVPSHAPKLFSYNADVDRVNHEILDSLPTPQATFSMVHSGAEPLVSSIKKGCLSPENLVLKEGASVMFTKNNAKEGFVNGTLGVVESFDQETGEPLVKTRDGRLIKVVPMDWQIEEDGKTLAKVSQIPLRLAWAITVHKSQGMSLDEAVMDLSGVFEYGQGYVALSRVRSLAGLHILDWNSRAFEIDPEVFMRDSEFQKESERAVLELKAMPEKDIKKAEKEFIIWSGGHESLSQMAETVAGTLKKHKAKMESVFGEESAPWKKSDDEELQKLFYQNFSLGDLASAFGRTKGAILARLKKLKIIEG